MAINSLDANNAYANIITNTKKNDVSLQKGFNVAGNRILDKVLEQSPEYSRRLQVFSTKDGLHTFVETFEILKKMKVEDFYKLVQVRANKFVKTASNMIEHVNNDTYTNLTRIIFK